MKITRRVKNLHSILRMKRMYYDTPHRVGWRKLNFDNLFNKWYGL